MITVLRNIFEVLSNIPAYILYAIESAWNVLVDAIDGVFSAATSLIALPEVPEIPYLSSINWFYPLGSVLSVLSLMVTGYITFLGVRYIFKWVGAL